MGGRVLRPFRRPGGRRHSTFRTPAGPVLTLALGAAAVDWIVFERVDYLADVQIVTPIEYSQTLYARGDYRTAEEYARLFLSLPGVSAAQTPGREVAEVLKRAEAVRASPGYVAAETMKGFFTGGSAETYGEAAGFASDLTAVGDVRDLLRESARWYAGEPVDAFTAGLSALGIVLTAAALTPEAPAAATAKGAVSILKTAKRAGKLPPRIERELVEAAAEPWAVIRHVAPLDAVVEAGARGGAKAAWSSFLQELDVGRTALAAEGVRAAKRLESLGGLTRCAATQGLGAALEVLNRSENLADIPRVVRTAEKLGGDAAAVLRFGGPGIVRAVEKRGVAEVMSVYRFGPEVVKLLDRLPAKTVLRDVRHFMAATSRASYRMMKRGVRIFEGAAAMLSSVLSVAGWAGRLAARRVRRRTEPQ